jgi:flavin-dependent dehydrogenase
MDKPSNLEPRKAMFAHLTDKKRETADEPNRITIIVHEPGVWIWVIPSSNGNTSVGFVGKPSFFDKFSGSNEEQFRAHIASQPYFSERFQDADLIFDPKIIQAWSTTTEKFYGEGFVLTGNVTEFLDPVFSSGVTLAAVSSQLAAGLVVKKLKGEEVDWEASYTQPMMRGVDTFRSYINYWYDGTLDTIFFASNQDPLVKSMICSVLAGYVWDLDNPYVKNHTTALKKLANTITVRDMFQKNQE